jgi:hypothetical protein
MIDERMRIHGLVAAKVDSLALEDKGRLGIAVTGPTLIMAPQLSDPKGPPAAQVGWQVMVTLKHDRLLGQQPVAWGIPIPGLLPPDEVFEHFAGELLEKCRTQRDEMNQGAKQDGLAAFRRDAARSERVQRRGQ